MNELFDQHLRAFCRDVLAALNSPESASWGFDQSKGLCYNSDRWAREVGLSYFHVDFYGYLNRKFGDPSHPFDNSPGAYEADGDAGLLYKNPERLAFLHTHAGAGQ